MHILFFTDNFPPEVNAPASRTYEHCREWVRAGNRVTVITCAPNFPIGKVYDGYRNRIFQREIMDGIQVVRVWSYIAPNEGFTRRILDYVSYMVSAVLASPSARGVDLVIGTSPQFFTACAAYLTSRIKGVPYVFELRDLWPESIKATGMMRDGPAIRLLERIEMHLYRKAARIICVTNSSKTVLTSRGIAARKIEVVPNGVDLARFVPRPRDRDLEASLGLSGKFVAGYVGTLGLAHGLETLLDAAAKTRAHPDGENVVFLVLGDGAMKMRLKKIASERALDNVIFLNSVPRADVARYWSLIDVSIIHLKNDPLFATVIPSKLFESVAMGTPVLHGVPGESAAIVEDQKLGIVFESENAAALCKNLIHLWNESTLRKNFRRNCLRARKTHDRNAHAMHMLGNLQSVLHKGACVESH